MPTGRMNEAVQQLRSAALRHDGAGVPDAQLLGWFVDRGDQAAFAGLVRRHGPMVWGVCRRVLRGHHDAEDAFQATFLVLVRRAAAVVPREMVANWLYGVAYQTARKARSAAARTRGRERQVTRMPEPAVADRDPWRDVRPVLDQELCQLPDKYRSAIVLCDLEGKSYKEAARQLAVPTGTLSGRLTRGRALLARRLARRGAVLSGAALAAGLSREAAASAGVPAAVECSVIRAAGRWAAGPAAAGIIPARVAALTEGVLNAMPMLKTKLVTGVVLVALAAGAAAHVGGSRHSHAGGSTANAVVAAAADPAPAETPPARGPAAPAATAPGTAARQPAAVEPNALRALHDAIFAHLKHFRAFLFGR